MGDIEKILERANFANITSFLIEGGELEPTIKKNEKTLDEQSMEAEELLEHFLKKNFKTLEEYEKAYDEIFLAVARFQEIYMELGMRTAYKILI